MFHTNFEVPKKGFFEIRSSYLLHTCMHLTTTKEPLEENARFLFQKLGNLLGTAE